MSTENLPTISSGLLPSNSEFQMLQVIAKSAQASGFYQGVGQEAKILMILLAARELGVSPMLALNGGIWNIQGKIEISARLMNSLIRRAGHSISIKHSDNHKCILLGKRNDGDIFECTFTIEEAAQAGLAGRDVWKKYTSDMLYNRCMSRLARRLFPDVIGNSYVEGEIREAIQPEKLPQADCEDVTQNCTECNEPPKTKINPEQIHEFQRLQCEIDETFKENMWEHLNKEGIATINDLHEELYSKAIIWMKNNIKMNKAKDEK